MHDLPVRAALLSDDPLIRSLAVADGRVGTRGLGRPDLGRLHPLARLLAAERLVA